MARKASRKKGKKSARAAPGKKPSRGAAAAPKNARIDLVQAGMHDLTNLATAVKAYLELLASHSRLEEKQKYYVDRAREQVEMMVDLVRELRTKLG